MTAYLRRRGSQDPDDVTSEVFVAMLRNLHRFKGDCPDLRSWIFTITHRRLLDERRRTRRRPPTEPISAAAHLPAPDDVEASVIRSTTTGRLNALCDSIAPDQGAVIRLRLLGHHTIDEIATILDKTPGAVKALQHRGFRALRRHLSPVQDTPLAPLPTDPI